MEKGNTIREHVKADTEQSISSQIFQDEYTGIQADPEGKGDEYRVEGDEYRVEEI